MDRAAGMEETSTEIDNRDLYTTVCGCVLGLLDTLKPEYAAALSCALVCAWTLVMVSAEIIPATAVI